MIPALTLCSGGGLADIGLQQAGYKIEAAIERTDWICEVYKTNLGNHIIHAPIESIDYRQFAGIQAIWASPPCQEFSQARNKSLPTHQDADVGYSVIEAIKAIQPQTFFLENVRGYAKSKVFQAIVNCLYSLNYWVEWRILNCADYGVPQNRIRLFLIAFKMGKDFRAIQWPMPQKRIGWYEAIAHRLSDCPDTQLAPWQAKQLSVISYQLSVNSEFCLIPRVGVRDRFSLTPESEPSPTIRALGEGCDRHWKQFDIGEFRIHVPWNGRGSLAHRGLPNSEFRILELTPRCLADLQTVPDWYQLPSVKYKATQIIGNGVPSVISYQLSVINGGIQLTT